MRSVSPVCSARRASVSRLASAVLCALSLGGCDRPPDWARLTEPAASDRVEVYATADTLQGIPGDTLRLPVRARPVRGAVRPPSRWIARQPDVMTLLPDGRAVLRQRGGSWVIGSEGEARDSVYVRSDTLYALHLDSAPTCTATPRVAARVLGTRGRVRVLEDLRNPPVTWTAQDLDPLLTVLADTVGPLAERTFGPMQDLDGDGRWLFVLTERINRLTAPGSTSFTAGFVAARDAFPSRQTERLFACAGGNSGEIFYGLAPDPTGQLGLVQTLPTIRRLMPTTAMHELQHLINLHRRLYETQGVPFEATWLNEAMSHLGEELLWQESTTLRGRGPWTLSEIRASGSPDTLRHPFWRFARSNLARHTAWMMDPTADGPIQTLPSTGQRGSVTAWLRHGLLDGWFRPDWRQMAAAPDSGLSNLSRWMQVGDVSTRLHNWHVIQALDASGWPAPRAALAVTPWSVRELAPALFEGRRPIDPSWTRGTHDTVRVAAGGTFWARLVGGADTLRLTPASTGPVAGPCLSPPWDADGVASLRLSPGQSGCWVLAEETLMILSSGAPPTGQPAAPVGLSWGATAPGGPAPSAPTRAPRVGGSGDPIQLEDQRHRSEMVELTPLVRRSPLAAPAAPVAPAPTGWHVTLVRRRAP